MNRGPAKSPLKSPKLRAIVGVHAAVECLKVRPHSVVNAYLSEGWQRNHDLNEIAALLNRQRIPFEEQPLGALDQIAKSHQGVALFSNLKPTWDLEKARNHEQVIILDGVVDPQNLGSIVRTAWLMDVRVVFVPDHRSTFLTAAVHKVASGGAEHVAVNFVPSLQELIKKLKDVGFWVYGLDAEGKGAVWDFKLPEKIAWCLGGEEKGLRKTTTQICDELVRIPQTSETASYNVGVTTGMALYEGLRQQKSKQK